MTLRTSARERRSFRYSYVPAVGRPGSLAKAIATTPETIIDRAPSGTTPVWRGNNNNRGGYWAPQANGTVITSYLWDFPRDEHRKPYDSKIKFQKISDGLSKTLLAGEKHVPIIGINTDGSIYNGDNVNFFAWAAGRIMPLARGLNDTATCDRAPGCDGPCSCNNFGSWHQDQCHFVFGDVHVAPIALSIDSRVLDRLATRSDGQPIGEY